MGLTLVTIEQAREDAKKFDLESISKLTDSEIKFIKDKFSEKPYGLFMARFHVASDKNLEKIAKSLVKKGIADYCSQSGYTIYSSTIVDFIKSK